MRGKFRIMKCREVIFILIVYQACVAKAIRHLIFQLSDDIFKLYLKQGSKTYIMVNIICVKKYLKENDPQIECTTLLNK